MSHISDFLVWGNNQSNILSRSASKCLSTPVPLSLPYEITAICASEKHISFLTKQGQLFSYGSNLDGRLGVSTRAVDKTSFDQPIKIQVGAKIIRAESGFSHMCILTEKFQLYAWGLGDYGALGTGQFKSRSTPTRVDLSKDLVSKLRQISCGAMHTAFLLDNGQLYTCGSNEYGELGLNKPEKVSSPVAISFHQPIAQVSCGVFYTLLLTRDGRVYGMGNNKYGQLGTGHKVNQCHPTLVRQLNDIVKVTAGYHSGAIDKFGNLYIWGSGSFGQILKPKKFVLSVPIKDIAIRGFFGVAVGHTFKNQNRIYSWGNNTFGQLGVGNYEPSKQPQQVQTLRGLQVNKIALGVNFAMVLLHPPTVQSRWIQQLQQQKERERLSKRSYRQQQKNSYPVISDRKSIIGFEQKYFGQNLRNNEQLSGRSTRQHKNYFQNIRSQKDYDYKEDIEHLSYSSKGLTKQKADKNKSYDRHQPLSKSPYKQPYDSYTNPQYSYLKKQKNKNNYSTQERDYQKLFLQLSEDYDILVKKYVQLERKFQTNQQSDYKPIQNQQKQQKFLQQNLALKNQIDKIKYEVILLNEEKKILKRKYQQLLLQNDKILQDQIRNSNITLSPAPANNTNSPQPLPPPQKPSTTISLQIEQQYNKLLTQKEQIISKLNYSLQKSSQQYKNSVNKLSQQNSNLKEQLNLQFDNNKKIINEHQSLIDELQIQIKKSQNICNNLREQNQSLRIQYNTAKNRQNQLQAAAQIKAQQLQEKQKILKQKYEKTIKQSLIKQGQMQDKICQLSIEVNYEKQFNRKYEQSLMEMKYDNQRLHKQLNQLRNISAQKGHKIELVKQQVEKLKKYKKEVDQKNIEIEQFNQNLQNLKKKSRQLLEQKQKYIKSQIEQFQKSKKQYQAIINRKDAQIQDFSRQCTRLQKQYNKSKQSISILKNQLVLKDDQLQHINQVKQNIQKKVNILSAELKKQVEQRETIVKQMGQAKRQLSKLKIINNQLEAKFNIELEQKNKVLKTVALKDGQISKLREEIQKINEKCDNLHKQNTLYRDQIQQVSYQLEAQTKINQELSKANRDFAQSQQEYTSKINELQAKIYELEDQNKSYTPRYQALLIRNQQLDQRNRQLGQMINKAIEIQAESYKNNILKQVQINTDNIIKQFKQEQEFQSKGRRTKNKCKQIVFQQESALTKRGQQTIPVIKEEPYTKMMKQRITDHKRKVSQSAQKLASLLDLNQKGKTSKGFNQDRNQTQDYEKINSQMESFNNQKQQFMSKIHSFAEKLKII